MLKNCEEIDAMLLTAGRIAERARRAGRSLTYSERLLLLEARGQALRANYSRDTVEALIEEGKRTVSGTGI